MSDPTVQVPDPVSVPRAWLERLMPTLQKHSDAAMIQTAEWALLQPAPTAEPERAWVAAVLRRAGCTFSDEGPIDELFDLFAGRTAMAETAAGRMPLVDALAAPPSIADMAPGTTFVAEGIGVPGTDHPFEVRVATDGTPVLYCHLHHTGARPWYVDPSTIRDVTPPKEADG